MITEHDITAFVALLRARLKVGAQQYGDRSFQRPLVEVLGEIEQELVDIAGWGLIAWVRLQRLRTAVDHAELRGSRSD